MVSWQTRLCSRFRSIAVGTKPWWLTRNTAVPGTRVDVLQQRRQFRHRHGAALQFGAQQRAPVAPGDEHGEHRGGEHQRDPAAARDLGRVAEHEREVDDAEQAEHGDDRARPTTSRPTRAAIAPSRVVMTIVPFTAAP